MESVLLTEDKTGLHKVPLQGDRTNHVSIHSNVCVINVDQTIIYFNHTELNIYLLQIKRSSSEYIMARNIACDKEPLDTVGQSYSQ